MSSLGTVARAREGSDARPELEAKRHHRLWLLRYARPQWRGLLALVALMGVAVLLTLLAPWPTKILVDNVLGDEPLSGSLANLLAALPGPDTKEWWLGWVALATVLLFLASTFVKMLNSYTGIGVRQRLTYNLGADLFHHLQRLSLTFHSRRPVETRSPGSRATRRACRWSSSTRCCRASSRS